MRRIGKRFLVAFVLFLGWRFLAGDGVLLAQQSGNQQKVNELIRSAQQAERIGYIFAGVGILLVIAAIPLGIYMDRKKKARKRGAPRPPGGGRPSDPDAPQR
jgi:hypothetical protein